MFVAHFLPVFVYQRSKSGNKSIVDDDYGDFGNGGGDIEMNGGIQVISVSTNVTDNTDNNGVTNSPLQLGVNSVVIKSPSFNVNTDIGESIKKCLLDKEWNLKFLQFTERGKSSQLFKTIF